MTGTAAMILCAALLQAAGSTAGAEGDTCLVLVADNIARGGGNFYLYHVFSRERVTLAEGDVLSYEIYLPPGSPDLKGGVDLWFEGEYPPLRDAQVEGRRFRDQEGIIAHGDGILAPAKGRWYRREIDLRGLAGRTVAQWVLASEGDRPGCHLQFVDNVVIRHADGSRRAIYENGPPPVNEPALAEGYSMYSFLAAVERAVVDLPEGADKRRALDTEVDRVRRTGRRLARLEDWKHARATVLAILALDDASEHDALEQGTADLVTALEAAVEEARFDGLLSRAEAALAGAEPVMARYTAHLVGHAHIDFQWLWEWPETVEVCRRTFRQALSFMDVYEEFTFTQSSAGLYAAVEEADPDLFDRIRAAVREGRWELAGGRITEADEHLLSEESHARQFLYGQRYFRERFGRTAAVGFEPDTFGHTAQMPQILRLGGCRYFYFSRGGKKTPLFTWEGPDGSRVLAFDEGATRSWYNSGIGSIQLDELVDFRTRTGCRNSLWVYGVGNHGGGPTKEQIESALAMRRGAAPPKLRFSTLSAFFEAVEREVDPAALPVIRGELNTSHNAGFYGTYTSHGDVKRWNRDAEAAAASAEVIAVGASLCGFPYPRRAFRKAWEAIAWNQHHDTICGSSVHAVYDRSREVYAEAQARCRRIGREALEWIAERLAPPPPGALGKLLVFNPLASPRDALVSFPLREPPAAGTFLYARDPEGRETPVQATAESPDRAIFMARDLPPAGYRAYAVFARKRPPENPFHVSERAIENERIRAEIDPGTGAVKTLFRKHGGGAFLAGRGERLEVFFEEPHPMSAWRIGKFLDEREAPAVKAIRVIEAGPVRAAVRMELAYHASTLTRTLVLKAGSNLLEVHLEIDWKEVGDPEKPAPFLKALVETPFAEGRAFYAVPFAAIERPADGAEVPALAWADLGDESRGLTLVNGSRHGYACKEGVLTLSLLRTPSGPDPFSALGRCRTSYALFPHGAGWREADTWARADAFNRPVWVQAVPANGRGTLPDARSFFAVAPAGVRVTGIKAAEDGDGIVVHCHEALGREAALRLRAALPIASAEKVDFLEDPAGTAPITGGVLEDTLPPWRIAAYKLRFAGPEEGAPGDR